MKKLLSVILCLVLLMGVCGCGNEPTTSKEKNPTSDKTDITVGNSEDETNNKEQSDENNYISDESSDENQNLNFHPDIDDSKNETTVLSEIPKPGTENWSADPNAYTVTVSNESIGKFQYMGWYLTPTIADLYQKMTNEHKKQFLKYVFEDEKINYIALLPDSMYYHQSSETGYDILHFKEAWHIGKEGLLDEIIKRQIPVFANITSVPYWMQSGSDDNVLNPKYKDEFARTVANLAYDLKFDCGINVVNVGIGDEPDGMQGNTVSACLAHYHDVVPLLNKYLSKLGLKDVGVIGAETCVIRQKWFNILRENKTTWKNLFAYSGHSFNIGSVNKALFNASRVTNKPLYCTSTGNGTLGDIIGKFLTVNKKGEEIAADYYVGIRDMNTWLNDVNMGANAFVMWMPARTIDNALELDAHGTNYLHLIYNKSGEIFEDNFVKTAVFEYYSQALNTVEPGATIYQCSNDKEGVMGGSFETNIMSATAGRNPDGTWGINLLNKTDSKISAPYIDKEYAVIPQSARTITVNLDIKGLYGTGAKKFKMYSANTDGGAREDLGVITLVDGRANIQIFPFEMISLRSVESIALKNKPLAINEVVKKLNIGFVDKGFIIEKGKKVSINKPLEMKYYEEYNKSGIKFDIEIFAKLLGAQYKVQGKDIIVYNANGMLEFKEGTSLARYSGNTIGALQLPTKVSEKNGKYYFELTDSTASIIGDIFGVEYNQYEATGLVVVGKTDIVNLGRFAKLFE